jgi:hypothetical protein
MLGFIFAIEVTLGVAVERAGRATRPTRRIDLQALCQPGHDDGTPKRRSGYVQRHVTLVVRNRLAPGVETGVRARFRAVDVVTRLTAVRSAFC